MSTLVLTNRNLLAFTRNCPVSLFSDVILILEDFKFEITCVCVCLIKHE